MILGQSPVLPASYGSPLVLPHKKIPKSKSRLENRGVQDFNVRGNKGAKENTPGLDLRFHTSPKKTDEDEAT